MDQNELTDWQQLVRNIETALAKQPTLTDQQIKDIERLRADLERLGRAGDYEEAVRCKELVVKIIGDGEPIAE